MPKPLPRKGFLILFIGTSADKLDASDRSAAFLETLPEFFQQYFHDCLRIVITLTILDFGQMLWVVF
jgi:hypothetical protein